MESATILMPPSTCLSGKAVLCFPSEPYISEGPEYEKNINTISMYGELMESATILTLPSTGLKAVKRYSAFLRLFYSMVLGLGIVKYSSLS